MILHNTLKFLPTAFQFLTKCLLILFTNVTSLHYHVISVLFTSSHLRLLLYYPILEWNWNLNRISSRYV